MSERGGVASTTDRRGMDRRIIALAVPAVGALIADPLLGAVDTAVAGRVSVGAQGALGLGVSLLGAGTWVFNFLVYGTTSAVARAAGGGDLEAAGRRVAHAAWVALWLGLATAALLWGAAELFVSASGAVPELRDPVVGYLRIRAVGLPLVLLAMVGHGAFRGMGDTRTPLLVVLVANTVNGTLDVLLVVVGGAGLAGIAWATVAAEAVALVMLVALVRRTGLRIWGHARPDRGELGALLRVSRDVVIRTGGLLLGLLLINVAAARVDAVTAAAHQVLLQVYILAAFVQDSVALAGQTMVGNALGRGDRDAARAIVRRLVRWGIGLGVVTAAVLLAGRGVVPGWLSADGETVALVAGVWWLTALVQLPGGVAFVLDGALMGAEDWRYLRTWTASASVAAGVAALVAVGAGQGLLALWWCMAAMAGLRAASLLLRVRGDRWLVEVEP